jgi:hypothetical protein
LVVLMTAAPSPPLPPVRPVAAVAAGDGGGGNERTTAASPPLPLPKLPALTGPCSDAVGAEEDSPSPPSPPFVARPPEAGDDSRPHALNPVCADASACTHDLHGGERETWRERHPDKVLRSSSNTTASSDNTVCGDSPHEVAAVVDADAAAVEHAGAADGGSAQPRPRFAILSLASAALDWLFAPSELSEIPREPKRPHQLHTYY